MRISKYILGNFLYLVVNPFQSRKAQAHSKRLKTSQPYLKSIITTDKKILKVNTAMHSPILYTTNSADNWNYKWNRCLYS